MNYILNSFRFAPFFYFKVLMLAASFQSMGDTIATTLYHLAKNPTKQEIAFKSTLICESELTNHYIRNCWYETLRLTPTIPFSTRKIHEPFHLEQYHIPSNVYLMYFKHAVGENTNTFGNNALEFIPERFDEIGLAETIKMYSPFGYGKRKCIGERFGEFASVLLIKRLLKSFEFFVDAKPEEGKVEVLNTCASVGTKPNNLEILKWKIRNNQIE